MLRSPETQLWCSEGGENKEKHNKTARANSDGQNDRKNSEKGKHRDKSDGAKQSSLELRNEHCVYMPPLEVVAKQGQRPC